MLTLSGLGVDYGGVAALRDLSITIPAATLVGLIGPNGAGKTTAIDAICGLAKARGSVVLDGHELHRLAPHRRVRLGLGRTFQGMELFEEMSARENISMGVQLGRLSGKSREEESGLIEQFGLLDDANVPVKELSLGRQRLVSIARALSGRPKIVLLDEPAAGLDATESRWLGTKLREVTSSGVAILLVDHDMDLVLSVCSEVYVMDFGELIASGSAEAIRRDPRVASAYLGRQSSQVDGGGIQLLEPPQPAPSTDPVERS